MLNFGPQARRDVEAMFAGMTTLIRKHVGRDEL
jgi:hypothetical protein